MIYNILDTRLLGGTDELLLLRSSILNTGLVDSTQMATDNQGNLLGVSITRVSGETLVDTWLHVLKAYRGQGVADGLVENDFNIAKEAGLKYYLSYSSNEQEAYWNSKGFINGSYVDSRGLTVYLGDISEATQFSEISWITTDVESILSTNNLLT